MGTIDFNDYAIFCSVCETGGYSSAAARLGIPKSSVSRAIATLERDLGVRLLHRTTRKVSLSTAGAALYDRVAQQIASLQRAADELPERDSEPGGLLRVTTLNDFGALLVGELAGRLSLMHPKLRVELILTERPMDLIAERIDVALRVSMRRLADSNLSARRVGRVRMQLFASPEYLARRGTPRRPGQLLQHDWATLGGGDPGKLVLKGLPSRGRVHCSEGNTLVSVLASGAGIGLLPTYLAAREVERGALVPVLPRLTPPAGDLWLVYPSAKLMPRKVAAFRDLLLETLRRQPELAI